MQIEITRRSLLAGVIYGALANLVGSSSKVYAAQELNIILGRPTSNSIALNLITSN
ncbi:MAG: hypothetical protein RIQ45_351, partial [Actinomycetota bacterium]